MYLVRTRTGLWAIARESKKDWDRETVGTLGGKGHTSLSRTKWITAENPAWSRSMDRLVIFVIYVLQN
jgi:hypothetical protein